MTPRERLRKAINHEEPDRVPLDLGSTLVTGIQASMYARLKKALGVEVLSMPRWRDSGAHSQVS